MARIERAGDGMGSWMGMPCLEQIACPLPAHDRRAARFWRRPKTQHSWVGASVSQPNAARCGLPQRMVLRGRLSHLAGAFRLGRVRIALWALGLGMWLAPPAAGAEPAPVWVWYRTSEGCPDGEAFVSRL